MLMDFRSGSWRCGEIEQDQREVTSATRQATPATAKSWQAPLPLNDMPTFSPPSLLPSPIPQEPSDCPAKRRSRPAYCRHWRQQIVRYRRSSPILDCQTWLRLAAMLDRLPATRAIGYELSAATRPLTVFSDPSAVASNYPPYSK